MIPRLLPQSSGLKNSLVKTLVVSANKLFCTGCREEVALKKSIVELHVKSDKHAKGKQRLLCKEKREQDIVKASDS